MLADIKNDADAVQNVLRQNHIACVMEAVEALEGFIKALQGSLPDLILAVCSMPSLTGLAALAAARERTSDIPIIFVTDAFGEQLAVDLLKKGVTDYVSKRSLGQLPAAVHRAIVERDDRRERTRAQEELKRLAEAIGSIVEGVAIISPELTFEYANPSLCTMTGYTANELLGKSVNVVPRDDTDAACTAVWKHVAAGSVWAGRLSHKRKDGIEVVHGITISPLLDHSGALTGYVAVCRDVSVEERLERQCRQAEKMDALRTLCGGIAHNFNNILAIISGFTELAAGRVKKGNRDEDYLRRVMEACFRGRDLIRQLLVFSRTTDQKKEPVLLSTVVKGTARLLRAAGPAKIRVRVRVVSESGLILGDPAEIRQVLISLATNAVYAMKERGGVIDMVLSDFSVSPSHDNEHGMKPGSYMKLEVRDTGTGIEPAVIGRIFDPFFTTKKAGEGTGLGLFVVDGVMTQTNGYVTVESEPGRGSTFTVYLPVVNNDTR
jgi:PAS domain S-box-containing protein